MDSLLKVYTFGQLRWESAWSLAAKLVSLYTREQTTEQEALSRPTVIDFQDGGVDSLFHRGIIVTT